MATTLYYPTGSGDATALNALMSAASSGDVFIIQQGIFAVDTTLLLLDSIKIEGASKTGTILQAGSGFGDNSMVYSNNTDNCSISNLTIDGNSENDTSGLQFRQSDNHVVQDLIIKNTGGHQLMFYGCDGATITNVDKYPSVATLNGKLSLAI